MRAGSAAASVAAAAGAWVTLAAGAMAVAIALLAALLLVAGYDPLAALAALWSGSFGSSFAVTSATLVRAIPLILAGLAVGLAFRAGVWNIGAEGQLLVGAAAAAAVALSAPFESAAALPLALLIGSLAGAAWAGIAALLRARFGVLEVISTIMLNFVALHLVSWLVRGPLQEPTRIYPQSAEVGEMFRMPRLTLDGRLHGGLVIAVLGAMGLWWFLSRTSAGFRVLAVGADPGVARSAGLLDVRRISSAAFMVSGAFAGLAGAVELTGVTYALYENISPGYGYTAIAIALLARLEPLMIVVTGVLFGALEAGAIAMQRDAGVPSVVVYIAQAVIILFALTVDRRTMARLPAFGGWGTSRSRARAAAGGTGSVSAQPAPGAYAIALRPPGAKPEDSR